MTVGSGFAPDLLTLRAHGDAIGLEKFAQALAGSSAGRFGQTGIPPVGNLTPP